MEGQRAPKGLGNPVSNTRRVRRRRIGASICGGIGLVLLASLAYAKGPGLRSGDVVIHPRFSVSGGYDSNFFRDSAQDATSPVNPVTVLKLGGGVNVANRNPNKALVKLDAETLFRYVTAEDADQTASPLDDDFAVETVKTNLYLSILPKNPFTLDLNGDLRYTERPGIEFASAESGPPI